MTTYEEKQLLIDLIFEFAMVYHNFDDNRTNEQIANHVSVTLKEMGFKTKPMGMSWGVLIE